jgi:hypothetical protein
VRFFFLVPDLGFEVAVRFGPGFRSWSRDPGGLGGPATVRRHPDEQTADHDDRDAEDRGRDFCPQIHRVNRVLSRQVEPCV